MLALEVRSCIIYRVKWEWDEVRSLKEDDRRGVGLRISARCTQGYGINIQTETLNRAELFTEGLR